MFASKTLFILYSLPKARSKCSLLVHALVDCNQLIVFCVVPRNVIPPPSAVTSEGVVILPNSMFLSSTVKVCELTVVSVPFTVKSPAIVTFPPTNKLFLIFVTPVAAAKFNVVALPNAFTVVAVVLSRLNVVWLVVISPPRMSISKST